jgi:steroid Delta-isomerase
VTGPLGRDALELLAAHVEAFNDGVRSGDFRTMADGFTPDAEMSFRGVPVGPFRGRQAIEAAYREQPPDDELRVLDALERDDGVIVARYAWARTPTTTAGEMIITPEGDRIAGLVVTFDPAAAPNPNPDAVPLPPESGR